MSNPEVVLIDDDDDDDVEIVEDFDPSLYSALDLEIFDDIDKLSRMVIEDDRPNLNPMCLKCGSETDLKEVPEVAKAVFAVESSDSKICSSCIKIAADCMASVLLEMDGTNRGTMDIETLMFRPSDTVVIDDVDLPKGSKEVWEKYGDHVKKALDKIWETSNVDRILERMEKAANELYTVTKSEVKDLSKEVDDTCMNFDLAVNRLMREISNHKTEEIEVINIEGGGSGLQKLLEDDKLGKPKDKKKEVKQIKKGPTEDDDVIIVSDNLKKNMPFPKPTQYDQYGPSDGLAPYNNTWLKSSRQVVTIPKPIVGDKCLVKRITTTKMCEWVCAEIIKIIDKLIGGKLNKLYTVKLLNRSEQYRDIDGTMIAYLNTGSNFRYNIGDRVLSKTAPGPVSDFIAGVVAELPTRLNSFRHLIFVDDGRVKYVVEKDMRMMFCQTRPVHEYFDKPHHTFIINYFSGFPERPMMKVQPGDTILVRFNDQWCRTRVVKVDSSMIEILYCEKRKLEWIYRGSPRIQSIYKTITTLGKAKKRTWGHRSTAAGPSGPAVQYEVISSDEEENSTDPLASTEKKPTAKKSAKNSIAYTESLPRRRRSERKLARLEVFGLVESVRPPKILIPRPNHIHTCTPSCVSWLPPINVNLSPLTIPSTQAFKRELIANSVLYIAPCGREICEMEQLLDYLEATKLELTVDMFDFDPAVHIFDEFKTAPDSVLLSDITNGLERHPIQCVNTIDKSLPNPLEYMTRRRELNGETINTDPNFLVCCDCKDNCRDKNNCSCWKLTISSAKAFKKNAANSRIGYKYRRMYSNLVTGIYECNKNCHCNKKTCLNRVVQHPIACKLQLFKTQKKGWGTRTLNDIPKGSFVCIYAANVLTEQFANQIGQQHGDEYLAELDYIEILEELKEDYEARAIEPKISKSRARTDQIDNEFIPSPDASSSSDSELEEEALRNASTAEELEYAAAVEAEAAAAAMPVADTMHGEEHEDESSQDEFDEDEPRSEQDEEEKHRLSLRYLYGKDDKVFVLDAKIAGNIGRYINHSCDPNMFVQNVFVDTHDLRFPWVAFFAFKHIPAGTELTWNYGYTVDSVPGKKLYCHCESYNCRKRLL